MSRETIRLVEVVQPFCTLTYGIAPCTAVLGTTGDRKCFNGRRHCQDPANYTPGTLTLLFARQQDGLHKNYNAIPSVVTVDTTPAAVNLGAMDATGKISPLGQRESVSIKFDDHLHPDTLVDKYRLERISGAAQDSGIGYDPYLIGTFWTKWLARNPYHSGYAVRVYEGEMGEAIGVMSVRHYIVDRIEGPNAGVVNLVAKDLLSKIEERKAVAPRASKGELAANIAASGVTTFDLAPAGIGNDEYPASGYVAIGDEIIQFTRSADTLTVVARGALNTTADEHELEDLVQVVLTYVSQLSHDIAQDLLLNYAEIPSAAINTSEWDTAASEVVELFTTYIAEPTPVVELLAELSLQAGFTIYHDVSTNMLKFSALRARTPTANITDDAWIIDNTLTVRRQDSKRVSQVWVYYGQINPLEDLEERRNYRSRLVSADLDAESVQQYGVPSIKEVYSRFIPQFGSSFAENVSSRILGMFRDAPAEAKFSIYPNRVDEVGLANYITLSTDQITDDIGEAMDETHAIVEVEREEDEIVLRTQTVRFSDDDGERVVHIDQDAFDLNLRTIHDTLYAPPVGGAPGETVTFIIDGPAIVGSTSTATPALRTGSWPAGVVLTLIVLGRIQGKGGAGGVGGSASVNGFVSVSAGAGTDGLPGGPAFLAEFAISIDNSAGEIWGGGGGGAGGGGAAVWCESSGPTVASAAAAGSGGGGGQGSEVGLGAGAGAGSHFLPPSSVHQAANGNPGATGTTEARGLGGTSVFLSSIAESSVTEAHAIGGFGGGGGVAGAAGGGSDAGSVAGSTANVLVTPATGVAATGGAAGNSVQGNSFITWTATGSRLGPIT